jgi:predicted HAD superfamily Cof-like phosphohydrolase
MENTMSDWANDIAMMHHKFGVREWFEANKDNKDLMRKYLHFRLKMCNEEMQESYDAFLDGNPEEIVDGLIDLCVFAIGTLDVFGVDANEAWDRVYEPNMAKEPGIKPGRPNPFGLPDLLKPAGWTPPSHEGNHGDLPNAF